MHTENIGVLIDLVKDGHGLKIRLIGEVSPFPPGVVPRLSKGQYIGISDHLILTFCEDWYLPGLLAFQGDYPRTIQGEPIHWVGGVSCQPWGEDPDIWYRIHPLFLRDVDDILAGQQRIRQPAILSCRTGIVTDRPYWCLEVPALTRAVLLHLDQIVIVRRKRQWKAPKKGRLRSKTTRGRFWGTLAMRPVDQYLDLNPDPEPPEEDPT